MNEEVVQGSNLLFYLALVALLSGITFAMWQGRRVRELPAKVRIGRDRAVIRRFDR